MTTLEEAIRNFSQPDKLKHYAAMMKETNECMIRHGNDPNFDTDKCENADLSIRDYYTFHTHPHGKITPSGMDIQTSERLGKKLMCIGLAPSGKIVCYDTSGRRIIAEYQV